jgi:AraC family transcriptional regulator of adaptative response / DNA-3-methyladenine glycosylase II
MLRLPYTPPLEPQQLFGHLVATAVPGVEEWRDGWYRRTVRDVGIVELAPRADHVALRVRGDAEAAVSICRFLLDLDAEIALIDAQLSGDAALAPYSPGRRVPHTVDPAEMALRAVLGQQVSTAAAATHTARLVREAGEPIDDPVGGLTHLFPSPAAVAQVDPETLRMPQARRSTLLGLAAALADGMPLEAAGDLPGIGPWTLATIGMRALGDADAFPASDLGVRRLLGGADPERWRPYRAYAVQHLWALGDHAINRLP